MDRIKISEIIPTGMPLYEMRTAFTKSGSFSNVSMSVISLTPGERIPSVGESCHDADEYSYIISGKIKTHCGGETTYEEGGSASLIPKGESHWCINEGDEPCILVCFMVK